MELKNAIRQLAKSNTGFDALIELATVTSLNEGDMTCDVMLIDEQLELFDVKLKPVVPGLDLTEMGIVSFPEIGSKVLIGQINNSDTDLFVIMCSKVKKMNFDAGSLLKMALDMQSGAMTFNLASMILNGGDNGGLPKIQPLVDKLNALEKAVNDLTEKFNTHKHTGVTTGGGISGLTDKTGSKMNLTQRAEIENKAIKQ